MLELKTPLPAEAVCVGIDVAKATLEVQIDLKSKPFTARNTPAGRSKLLKRMSALKPKLASIVVESTGGYERPLLFELMDAGLPVAHVNPRVVRDYAKSFNQLAKTDPVDARVLACYAREHQPRLMASDDKLRHMLADLNRCRRQLLEQITAMKNQAQIALNPITVKVLNDSAKLLIHLNTILSRDQKAREAMPPESPATGGVPGPGGGDAGAEPSARRE